MKTLHITLAIMAISLFTSCLTTKPINSASVNYLPEGAITPANGITYMLPKTVLRIEIESEKTIYKTGPFHNYAERLLNVSNIITEDKEVWQIKSVHITTFGVADNTKNFAIIPEGNTMAQYLNLASDGTLLGVNLPSKPSVENPLKTTETQEIFVQDITFDSVPLREKHLKATSVSMMAELVANSIYKYRKRQSKLLGFEFEHHPCDAPTLQLSVDELKKQEEAFTEMFVGKTIKQTFVRTFDITPEAMSASNQVLSYFSTKKGWVDADDESETPIYYNYTTSKGVSKPNETYKNTDLTKHGFYYCQPVEINFTVTDKSKTIANQKCSIAQLGKVVSLPAELTSSPNATIELNPTNGALLRIGKIGQ